MQQEFIPFDTDSEEELPCKRPHLSKEEQLYGVFFDKPKHKPLKSTHKIPKKLNETELEHTYGKGLSLLQKHGYKIGEGLGKNSQGRTDIIGVDFRRKNEGLSYSKCENSINTVNVKKNTEKTQEFLGDLEKGFQSKVINTSVGNVETLKKTCIIEDTLLSLNYEEKQLVQGLEELEAKEKALTEMLNIIGTCEEGFASTLKVLKTIHHQGFAIYHELFMHENFTIPIMQAYFTQIWSNWVFGKFPLLGLSEATQYQSLGKLEDIMEIWYLPVSQYFSVRWNPKKELGSNIDALEIWKSHIPEETWEEVKKVIINRLSNEIDRWNPTKDHIAIHTWIHPWLSLIDLAIVWKKIISKITPVLHDWNVKDDSARLLLAPWKPVFLKEWDDLVTQNILPKLLFFLQELEISNFSKASKEITYFSRWIGLIPKHHLALGMQKIFYPRWRKVLEDMVDLDIKFLLDWVKQWKKLIPEDLVSLEI